MKNSEFWELMEQEFGTGYARTVARSHVIHALADLTAQQALDAGTPPRRVWEALVVDFEIAQTYLKDRGRGR